MIKNAHIGVYVQSVNDLRLLAAAYLDDAAETFCLSRVHHLPHSADTHVRAVATDGSDPNGGQCQRFHRQFLHAARHDGLLLQDVQSTAEPR